MKPRVLIVEDEPNIAESVSFLLARAGCDVTIETDGGHALRACLRTMPDLVILDAMLPNRNGFEILAEIKRTADLAETPVIMLTAKSQTKDRARAIATGVDLFMTKPFDNAELVENVLRLLQANPQSQPHGARAS